MNTPDKSHKKLLLALTCSALVLLPAASGFANPTNGPTIGSTLAAGEQVITNLEAVYNNVGSFSDQALGAIEVDAGVADQLGIDGATLVARGQQIRSALNSPQGQALLESGSSLVTTAQTLASLSTDDIASYATNLAVNEGTALLTSIAPQEAGLVLAAIDNPTQGAALALEYSNLLTGEQAGVVGQVLNGNPSAAVPFIAQELGIDLGGVDVGQLVNDPAGYLTNQAVQYGQEVVTDLLAGAGAGAFGDLGGDLVSSLASGDFNAQTLLANGIDALASGGLEDAAASILGGIDPTSGAAALVMDTLGPEATEALDGLAQAAGFESAADLIGAGDVAGGAAGGAGGPAQAPFLYEIENNWVQSLMMMTEQLTVAMSQQSSMIGQFLDAKHQQESERLLQQLQAQAHKDYHPSEQMCTIGTMVRSLAQTEGHVKLAKAALNEKMRSRELASGQNASFKSRQSDMNTRQQAYEENNCNPLDNAQGLEHLCEDTDPANRNADATFLDTIELPLTLDINFSDEVVTDDERNVFSLLNNLFIAKTNTYMPPAVSNAENLVTPYQDLRAQAAMHSIARNSMSNIIAQRVSGPETVSATPYMRAAVMDFGLTEAEITELIGVNPSYFAQMELLTKKMYQNPNFFTNLYDKPANVQRMQAAMQGIEMMQNRDIYNAILRREMLFSMLLESGIHDEQKRNQAQIYHSTDGFSDNFGP